ncbi:Hsp70 family protein [Actinophytocola sp. S1-96]|uniref:Hsp70 family protein n=1 Tax=Actinophytocola gossypii TaxID=2812003 RepID=A0ABT2J2I0_9PSEU|nr:Hsp70 family protein [Actinophytocola gossypii]
MRVLSIDLGTSNTVAVLSAHGRPPRVVDVDGASTMPSAVFAADGGRLVAGREALRLARTAPARFEPNPKRRIDEGNLLLGDAVVPVATALAAVLGKVVAETGRQLGGSMPDQVRLTHPAQWGSARRAVLLDAARQAGIDTDLRLVPEPVAAAAHFASVTGRVLVPGQALAVYDLGAGTFDVAVVGAGQQGLTVLAESGLTDLGGRDIDQALLDHLGRQVVERDPDGWQRLVTPRSAEDRRAALVLRDDVRVAKEVLSEHPQTEVALPEPFGSVLITRTELETLIRPGLWRSVELLGATTRGAGLDVHWLTGVYLVGGSSRVPLVATLMAERLGVVPTALDQPETAVALGAHQVDLSGGGPFTRPTAATRLPQAHQHGLANPAFRRGPRRAAVVGALTTVIVAAVVAVIVLAPWRSDSSSSTPDPSAQDAGPNGKFGFHWSLTMEEAGIFESLWVTDSSVVFGHWQGLTAYDVESGTELWSWDFPEGGHMCNMSQSVTENGLGAVIYGPSGEDGEDLCHNLQTISLETGEPNWDEPVSLVAEGSDATLDKLGGMALSINSDIVTAPYAGTASETENSTDVTWVDTESGERLGATDDGIAHLDIGCGLSGYAHASPEGIIAIATCPNGTPMVMQRKTDDPRWVAATRLDGCGEISNRTESAFIRQGGSEGDLVVGCYRGGSVLGHLTRSIDGSVFRPVPLDGLATGTIVSAGGAAHPLQNLVTGKGSVYLPRGEGSTSDGVVAVTENHSSWEYAFRDTTEVRLMGVDQDAVTVMVVTPGPAALYTISGPNEMAEAPELAPDVADELVDAERSYRVGDYLVCGFRDLSNDHPVIGVVRMVE